jgi:hypothetical protein
MNFSMLKILTLILLVGCSSCKPNGIQRPDAPLCTVTSLEGECVDARGDYSEPHQNLMCTSLDGYLSLEKYLDELELEVIRLRRRCK